MKLARFGIMFALLCSFAVSTNDAEAARRRRVIRQSNGRYVVVIRPETNAERLPRYTPGVQQDQFDPATTRENASGTLQWKWLGR